MNFLKNRFLLIIAFGILALSTSAYGYIQEHFDRLWKCNNNKTENCDLRNTDLSDQKLNNLHLIKPDFTNAILDDVDFYSQFWKTASHLIEPKFNNASCINCNFYRAYIPDADFTGTDLRGADLRIKAASFGFGSIGEYLGVGGIGSIKSWENAKYDEDTIFPEGFNPEEHGMILCSKHLNKCV